MRILVAAKRVIPDRTSEGICSSKFIAALAAGGHQVSCVAGERADGLGVDIGRGDVRMTHVDVMVPRNVDARLSRSTARLAATGALGALIDRKANAACAYATGHSLRVWHAVRQWREAIQAAIRDQRPDVLVVRGAGREFEPHMAMLGTRWAVPWIAHYHDPYPLSLYPEPYGQRTPLLSDRQERIHRRIVAECDALVPSRRLLEWVLRGDLQRFRAKAFVVPHIASEPHRLADESAAPLLKPQNLNIVHTGTLLQERDPRALLRGLAKFTAGGAARADVRLVMVGRVDAAHLATPEWQDLSARGLLQCHAGRISYPAAIGLSRAADALVILEANARESPFFPAKLADYLWLGKPILALSPRQSVTTDTLGADYALTCMPGDDSGVAVRIERLWQAWRSGTLSTLAPAAATAAAFSETAVRRRSEEVAAFVLQSRNQRVA